MAISLSACRAALIGAVLLSGCTLGPDFHGVENDAPASFIRPVPGIPVGDVPSRPITASVDPAWWRAFNDPVLDDLVTRAASANFDVLVATERLAQSRAQLGVTRADGLPQLNSTTSYTREKISNKGVISLIGGGSGGGSGGSGGIPAMSKIYPFDLFQQSFDASWELDFFGRIRRQTEGAEASVQASEETRRNTLVSMLAEVARDYIQLRGTQATIAVTKANFDSAQQALTLTRQLRAGGFSSSLDVANAQTQLANTGANLPQLKQQEAQSQNALALLLGEPPGALQAQLQTARPIPFTPPTIPIGLPSELAHRRPDIRQAEAQLHMATAEIGAAQADFFPKITLSGSVGVQSLQLKNIASYGAISATGGPSISIPIFQGGRLRATLEIRKSQQREAAVTYEQTLYRAFHEIDDALTAYAEEQHRRDQLQDAVDSSHRAAAFSRDQYRSGLTGFLPVLDAERTALAADQQLASSDTTIATNLVQLYKALGGGWEATYPVDPNEAPINSEILPQIRRTLSGN